MIDDRSSYSTSADSFRILFDTYLDRVHDYISAISKSDYIAEEVTQELFLILWRKRNDLHEVRNMDQYVFRIARNLAIGLLKKAAADGKKAIEFYRTTQRQTSEVTDKLNGRITEELIHKAVMGLPPQPRKIYLLSRRENMSLDEIAAATGLSRNTVKNHLQKALHDIRAHLVQYGYPPLVAAMLIKVFA
jgi:RNA polymerase sigma-70 factor (ECF subfamily)